MKNLLEVIVSGSLCTASVHAAGILAGPIYNPATTHSYFLLTSSSWTEAETAAISLGGHLVTVNDAAENDWLLSTFSNFGGQPRALWTGLTDTAQEGVFTWSGGEEVSYTNWETGQPDDGGGIYPHEDYVLIWPSPGPRSPGYWNDYINTNTFTQLSIQVFGVVEVAANINNWTNPSSAKWESPSWSLGTLPGSDQVVNINNDGYKAVNIDPTTVANFPSSLTVGSLEVSAPTNGLSTLLLNYFGLGMPLKVLNSSQIGSNGTILNLGSSFEVDGTNGGALTIDGGTFIQNGGLTVVKPAVQVLNGSLNATNATMNLGPLQVGGAYPELGTVYQSGGTVLSSAISIGRGQYLLESNGTLYSLNGTSLTNTEASFVQTSGSNYGDVDIEQGSYDMEDGLVQGVNLSTITLGSFTQNGGTVQVQNLSARGLGTNFSILFPSYNLNTGTLYSATLNLSHYGIFLQSGGTLSLTNGFNLLDASGAGARFALYGGTALMPSLVVSNGGDYVQRGGTNEVAGAISVYNSAIGIQGGQIAAADLGIGEGARLYQTGGTVGVSDVLSITGSYTIEGGNLSVNGIYMRGTLLIDNLSGTPVLNNSGLINFGGTLAVSVSQNSMGQLGLSADGVINLEGSTAVVRFADSSALNWDPNSRLVIEGWNGSSSGNGSTQIYFGNSTSGLTPAQLSQIQFSVGSTNYSAKILGTGEVVADQVTSTTPGVVNSWTIPGSGNWDQVTNWSLGVLPDNSQSVFITNSVWKAVAINASTPIGFPDSMTVSNLTIRGASDTQNVLLLNNAGTQVPLTVLNGLTLQDDGRIVDLNSGLVVEDGMVLVTNSQMTQDGGLVVVTTAQMQLSQAEYDITNGVFEAGLVWIGAPHFSTFNQFGGTVTITNLSLGPGNASVPHGGAYALYGGNLNLPGGLSLLGYPNNATSYLQEGGTNQTTQVYVSPESDISFKLNGGLLADNNVSVVADNFGTAAITQNGGSHIIANTLSISGSAENGQTVVPATYSLNDGTLSASTIDLGADQGDSGFMQSNGNTYAGTIYAHSLGYYSSHNTSVMLSGGTLSCSNYTTVDGGGTLTQTGGGLVVSNLMDFGGSRNIGGFNQPSFIYGRYTLLGGTLMTSNISITGDCIIGDGTTNRISNPGFFSLSHRLQISNAVEQLGGFILATNATIDLAGSASRLSFANSSGEVWAGSATLVIANWNGDPNGGGAEQLKFGSDQTGLTPAQLTQIQFSIGSSTNLYPAKILSTGEVVPNTTTNVTPDVAFSSQGTSLILSWPAGWSLQSATNVVGPYLDIPGATPPYTNNTTSAQQQFFRLRQGSP